VGVVKSNRRSAANAIAAVDDVGWPDWVDALATRRLQEAIRGDRIGHAYLLSGPPGVGKAATARAFAQALCCTKVERADRAVPCGLCRACRNVQRGVHPDVETFNLESQVMLADKPGGASSLSIDTVRRLRSSGALFPLESDRRILIVDDAETLLEPAQQALLKTLEEPPKAVTLFLLADEPEALLETVRSRCQEIPIRPIPQAAVAETLLRRSVSDMLATEIAMLSRGCAAWALAAVADKKFLDARREERASAARWIASPRYEQLVTAFNFGDQYSKRRSEVIGTLQAAIQLFREDMIGAAQGAGQAKEHSPESLSAAQRTLSFSRAIAATLQCLSDLSSNVRPRLALEAMVVAWPNSELRGR
jgi:DNA polymerase III subunit delta'